MNISIETRQFYLPIRRITKTVNSSHLSLTIALFSCQIDIIVLRHRHSLLRTASARIRRGRQSSEHLSSPSGGVVGRGIFWGTRGLWRRRRRWRQLHLVRQTAMAARVRRVGIETGATMTRRLRRPCCCRRRKDVDRRNCVSLSLKEGEDAHL